jgi:hypothetical protein
VRARVSPRPVAVAVALQGGEGAALLLPSVAVGGWSSFVAVASPVSPFPFAASGFRLFEGGRDFVRSYWELKKLDGFVSPRFRTWYIIRVIYGREKCESNPALRFWGPPGVSLTGEISIPVLVRLPHGQSNSKARSAARSARTGIVCDGDSCGVPAIVWADEAALHCAIFSRLQWRRGYSQHRRRAGQRSGGARSHLRPPINAAIFLSIRGLGSGRVGTQPNTLNWGKDRLLF